jgi:hypothetical protein
MKCIILMKAANYCLFLTKDGSWLANACAVNFLVANDTQMCDIEHV